MGAKTSDSTVRLDDTIRDAGTGDRAAIRWMTPGPRSRLQVIDEARLTFGRGPGVTVTVTIEAAGLSRCHAEIYREGPALIAHDLGSTNGTYVNGRRAEYAPLVEGDVLRLGDVVGVMVRLPPDALPDAPDLDVIASDLAFGPGLRSQLAELRRVAPTDLPVVIVGETGAGKEYIAGAVHALGGRRGKLHAVNCAALPPELAEAELFGHARGAFTGAEQAGLGHVRAADGGTLFLDELGDLPLPVQAKLLRVLQERRVTPLGETRAQPVDLRIVAACQRPLDDLVAARRLRQDLAARLAGLTVTVPPLRERRADIGVFFRHFVERHGGGTAPLIDPRLVECLLLYRWPGNLRELELLARRLLALHAGAPVLRRSFLPAEIAAAVPPPDETGAAAGGPGAGPAAGAADRDEHDRRRLVTELRRHAGNITRAATAAGISRSRAYRLMGDRSPEQFLAAVEAGGGGAADDPGPGAIKKRR